MHNWREYLTSRFPLVPLFLFCLFTVVGIFSYIQMSLFSWHVFVLSLMYLQFLFHLRILDEYKDFEYDTSFHTNRPVQKGSITLKQLKILGVTNAMVMIFFSILISHQANFFLFLTAVMYTFLMYNEFFIKDFYHKTVLGYLVLHEVVFIPLFLFFFSGALNIWWYPQNVSDLSAFVYVIMPIIIVEIGRKMKHRTTAKGKLTDDTYLYMWGERTTLIVFSTLILCTGILSRFIQSYNMNATTSLFLASVILYIITFNSPSIMIKNNMSITTFFALGIPLLLLL